MIASTSCSTASSSGSLEPGSSSNGLLLAGAAALSAALLLQLAALAQSLFVGVGLHVDGVPLSVYKTKCVLTRRA